MNTTNRCDNRDSTHSGLRGEIRLFLPILLLPALIQLTGCGGPTSQEEAFVLEETRAYLQCCEAVKSDMAVASSYLMSWGEPKQSPLVEAIQDGHLEVAKILATHSKQTDLEGNSEPLQTAVRYGHIEMVRRFIGRGLKKEVLGKALIAAVKYNRRQIVEFLLQAGADVNSVGYMYESPLNAAIDQGNLARILHE